MYESLSRSGEHLLTSILGSAAPRQWAHYPEDDAVDAKRRFQWYYHAHSPTDRPGAIEHGHFHLFARTDASRPLVRRDAEAAFLAKLGTSDSEATTRHLLAIGMSPQGVPISLFTVNRWVTGDQLLSSEASLKLLQAPVLDTGHEAIDHLISSVLRIHQPRIRSLFRQRDQVLGRRVRQGSGALDDESLEVLSEVPVVLDAAISSALRRAQRT